MGGTTSTGKHRRVETPEEAMMSTELHEQLERDLAAALGITLTTYAVASRDGGKSAALCETLTLPDPIQITRDDVIAFVAKHEQYTLHEWEHLPGWTRSLGNAEEVILAMRERGYSFALWVSDGGVEVMFHDLRNESTPERAHGSSPAVSVCEAALDALRFAADTSATTA